jgi:hypothetical protein
MCFKPKCSLFYISNVVLNRMMDPDGIQARQFEGYVNTLILVEQYDVYDAMDEVCRRQTFISSTGTPFNPEDYLLDIDYLSKDSDEHEVYFWQEPIHFTQRGQLTLF